MIKTITKQRNVQVQSKITITKSYHVKPMMNYHTLPEIESYYCCGIWERSDAGELSTGHQQGAPGTSHEGETEDQGKPATPSNYIKVQPHSDKRDNSHWEK